MSKIQKGENLIVSIGGKIYGFAKSCDLDLNMDTREISAFKQQAGGWKNYDADKLGWSVNSEHLATVEMTDEDALFDAMISKVSVEVKFEQGKSSDGETFTDTDSKGYKGMAFITSFKISAAQGDDATYSISLQGTGPLTKIQ